MDAQLLRTDYATQAAPYMAPTVVLLAIIYLWTYMTSSKVSKLPDLGNSKRDYMERGPQLMREGYARVCSAIMFRETLRKNAEYDSSTPHGA